MAERKKESADYIAMRDLALTQLRSGKSLTGEGGVFAPIVKEFLESALSAEIESHLDEEERSYGNKRNGRSSKTLKTSSGEITIETPQDRHSSFTPQIVRKRETILADNLAPQIIGYMAKG
jgi:putative transposase